MNEFNAFNVYIPHFLCFLCSLFFLLYLCLLAYTKWTNKRILHILKFEVDITTLTRRLFILFIILLISAVLLILVPYTSDEWMRAKPTEGWEKGILEIDTAIILGFGYETDKNGNMEAGEANEFLLNWVINKTNATTILVQEGVWVAACNESDTTCLVSGREIKRIHLHDENVYVNTFDAAFCALENMEVLDKKKAILVAHDLQLKRVARDFEIVKQARKGWQDFIFVIPKIPDTPYLDDPPNNQKHTRNEFYYRIVELICSRPRDFKSEIPTKCKAPL